MGNLIDIYNKITVYSDRFKLMECNDRILVTLSGGADSVFLLHYLINSGKTITAVHCNFHLRGEESMRDEEFVRNLCSRLNVPLHVENFETEEYAKTKHVSIEMAARELRYGLFEQLRQTLGYDKIAVAHHRDDNIETMILNLVRGTGIKGLKGIQPKNGYIIRPMLCISREDILNGLAELHQDYVTDSTNLETIYSRNKVRLEVVPLLKTINQSAAENITTTIENLQEVSKIYEASIEASKQKCVKTNDGTLNINIKELRKCPSPISVLHEVLSPLGFNRSQINEILNNENTGKIFESATHRALIDREEIIVEQQNSKLGIQNNIKVQTIDISELKINPSNNYAYIDVDKVVGELYVRKVQTGDSFQPFGMKGRKLLSDFLTDQKLNRFEKENQLVVCDDNDIVWVVGRRSSEKYKVDKSTKKVMELNV